MEKYVTNIKDLVNDVLSNQIVYGESMSDFRNGIVHLLGINTPIDFTKAGQFLAKPSLVKNPDANRLLGFIEECQGDFSSAFKHYALAVENSNEKSKSSYLQKINKSRDNLQKKLSKLKLPLVMNEKITKILKDCDKGTAKSKLNSKIILATICDDKSFSIDVAEELFKSGDYYSSYLFLKNSNVENENPLYEKIAKKYNNSKMDIELAEKALVELEGKSLLTDYVKELSISRIKNECDNNAKSCMKMWCAEVKKNIDKLIKAHKKAVAREEAQKRERKVAITLWIIIPIIVFVIGCLLFYYWDFSSVYYGGLVFVVIYYVCLLYFKF